MTSILNTVKEAILVGIDCTDFDNDIILHTNSVLAILTQLGVGPKEGYSITGASETWEDFMGSSKLLNTVKTYVTLKVRLIFDPPQTSATLESLKQLIAEYEWRINAAADPAFQPKEVPQ